MIIVKNRELLIPREEYNIGTNYDDNSETRVFRVDRVTAGGVDISNLAFMLDIEYANGKKDSVQLDKEYPVDEECEEIELPEIESGPHPSHLVHPVHHHHRPPRPHKKDKDFITLVLTVTNGMLQVPGTVLIQIRGLNRDGGLKWTSYQGALFVEDAINTPAHYTGDLTWLETLEAELSGAVKAEKERVEAEEKRAAAEELRQTSFAADQIARAEMFNTAELERREAFEEAQEAMGAAFNQNEHIRETEFTSAISEFNTDRSDLMQLAAEAKHDAALSKQYMEEAQTIIGAVIPQFEVDFDDGEVHYDNDAVFKFNITADGNLTYTKEE